ncbi:sulfotransferase family protein [Tsukamurella paurometabola]|uniref:Sulfotransferase n=1 Tax=Tsukamurella paurometabola TaxID=2061 RepID=A0ABS5NC77_TSUPA|nr:sulfotransferase [Tsukamurella paurometabola]MBS4101850.1 sulfotransferase [Tsukamurella paurometabola]
MSDSNKVAGTRVGTADDLHESAMRRTGLRDFGDPSDGYREALQVLLDSYREEAALTELGSKLSRVFLRGALSARLISEAAFAANPAHAEIAVERPIFVTGLPRSGTTALHRLLDADPGNQGLQMWLAEVPQPRPPRATWAENPVYRLLDEQYAQHHTEHPEFMGLHYMSASEVEECWQLLRQSVHSVSYECLAHVPSYAAWLAERDWTPAYRRHKRNLQLIGMNDPGKRWVLKNPSHLFALDAVFEVYPDALIVQCHRPAETIIASVCSLAQHATEGWSTAFTGATIGADQLDTWARGLAAFDEARARHTAAGRGDRFVDVDYRDLVADPLGTVGNIYSTFGLDLTDDARQSMSAMHDTSRSGARRPNHTYALEDYGLTEDAVRARFH